jgi:predicted acetyltransferase
VTAVTVSPTHRRQGLLGRLAGAQHVAARERGEPVAMLFASEFPIYGRFGYGPATTTAAWNVQSRTTRLVPGPPEDGRVELVAPNDEAVEMARGVYEAHRLTQPGEVWRRPVTWKDDFGLSSDIWGNRWKGFLAVHRDAAGAADGFTRYHAEEKWEDRQPRARVIVDDLIAVTRPAEAALWRFLFDLDLVSTIRAERRTLADRLPWMLTNQRAAVLDDVGDGLWVKLVDIPAALEARRYESSGSVVVELIDRDGLDADAEPIERRVRVALDVSADGARATLTDRSPDVTIDAAALAAAYLGGTRLADATLRSGSDEHRGGALRQLDLLLRTPDAPWCSSFF